MLNVQAYINGEWTQGSQETTPYFAAFDGAQLGTSESCSDTDVDRAVTAARAAQQSWAAMPLLDKADLFYRAYDICLSKNEAIAQAISREMGKTIHEAREEMELYGALHFRRAAEDMMRFRGQTLPDTETRTPNMRTLVQHYPLGVIGVISPFNFPVDIPAIGITYALISGNTVVWKPSDACPGSTSIYASIFEEAGFPAGVFNFVPGAPSAGARLVEHDDVNGIFFTGSTAVGRSITERAGFKRLLLELGGMGPLIVHADAEIDRAVDAAVNGCFYMAGQVCTSAQRVLVHRDIEQEFVTAFTAKVAALTIGDPLDERTDMGPLIHDRAVAKMQEHVEDARAKGATVHQFHEAAGRVYPPTVLTGVTGEMLAAREETFGPIAAVMTFDTVEQAIEIANDTEYGLNAAVFTQSVRDSWKFIDSLQFGTVLVNETTNFWDQLAPFGGVKSSGVGRELSTDALLSFTEKKTIVLNVG
jgi:succinate-semialdehyde dehydrogenase/glutarate-semialdehyde dehydrogenase